MKRNFRAFTIFGLCILCLASVSDSKPLNLTLEYFHPTAQGRDGTIGKSYLIGLENLEFQRFWYHASGIKFGYLPNQYTSEINFHIGFLAPPFSNGIPYLFGGIGPDILFSNLTVVPEPGSNRLRVIQISLLSVHVGCILFKKVSLNSHIWVSDPQLFTLGIGYLF